MKKLILVLPLLISVLFVNAQFSSAKTITLFPEQPSDVKSFDIDGDGDLDVLSSSMDGKISWYENLGSDRFGLEQIVTTNINAYNFLSMDGADIDGDGDIDVLVCSYYDDKVAWYENFGNGIFGLEQIITTSANGPRSIYSVDIDNDGDIDILSASSLDDKIAWYENLGNGTFGQQQIIAISESAISVCSADIDNDGDMDVFSTSEWYKSISWHENLGNGVFGSQQTITTSANGICSIYSEDLNNDGYMDILSASSLDDKIAWYRNLGNGNFGPQQIISSAADGANDVYSVDIDNDGYMDVISSSSIDLKVAWYKNQGNGVFGPQQIINTLSPTSVYAADLDNDGNMDILSSSNDNKIAYYKNNGGGVFSFQQIVASSFPSLINAKAYDLDGDLDMDIISGANGSDKKIVWHENLGGGVFCNQKIISTTAPGIKNLHGADLDGDGDIDVLALLFNKLLWHENLGGGLFAPEQHITSNINGGQNLDAADLDGDGDLDVLCSSLNDDKITWYKNLGGGTIDTVQNIVTTSTDGPTSAYAIDFDNDGKMDVISTSNNESKIKWYKNLGGGVFSYISSLAFSDYYCISFADIDEDGNIDVIFGSWLQDEVGWLRNLGAGNFSVKQIISTTAGGASSVSSADVDGDGDLDILSTYDIGNSVAWYENLGNGSFSSQIFISNNQSPRAKFVLPTDIDGDGDKDIIVTTGNGDENITLYENYFDSFHKIKGIVFYDSNQNAQKDSSEFGLNFMQTYLQPNSLFNYTKDNGEYYFAVDTGSYTVSCVVLDTLWHLTTDSNYTRLINNVTPASDSLNFGVYPYTILTTIQPELTGAFPRCNDTINYWANIRNEGTTLPNGIVHLQLGDSISFVSSVIAPDSIIGQNIYWHFDSLFFYAEEMINLQVQMPPFTSMGDTLTSTLIVTALDSLGNTVYSNADTLKQELVCAYDPNDKTVLPKGTGSQGFIANNQPMEYLIRFQNTGNDTALTVMVRDQLDDNLDWSSLKPLASSHPMQVWIEQDGEAVFKFNNIMLPDSNVDFLGSQGFVKFSINQKPNLAPNTPIFNTGHIYFDYNPAVITNTVLNTIEDTTSFPVSVQEITFTETNEIIVFPNPFTEHITVYYKANINAAYHVSLFDMSGKELLKKENITNNKTEFDVSQLKNGIYIIVGTDTNGKKLFSERIVAQ